MSKAARDAEPDEIFVVVGNSLTSQMRRYFKFHSCIGDDHVGVRNFESNNHVMHRQWFWVIGYIETGRLEVTYCTTNNHGVF